MVMDTSHRHPGPPVHFTGGQHNLQFPSGKLSILIKGLIKITERKKTIV
jgi:hypothetical protein